MAPKQAAKAAAVTRQPHVAATSLDAARRKEEPEGAKFGWRDAE